MCVVFQWKKHWFVLTDAGLKYYRDSGAEEVFITVAIFSPPPHQFSSVSAVILTCQRGSVIFPTQNDEPDGEIDLNSCLKVSEFDVEKNYGFQIQVPCLTAVTVSPLLPVSLPHLSYLSHCHTCLTSLTCLAFLTGLTSLTGLTTLTCLTSLAHLTFLTALASLTGLTSFTCLASLTSLTCLTCLLLSQFG